MEELFRDFWWLMFPIFGMVMTGLNAAQQEARTDQILRQAREQLERRS